MDFKEAASKGKDEILSELGSSVAGLNKEEADARLAKFGPNLIEGKPVTAFQILLRQFKSPFIYLLLVAIPLTILLGEIVDGAMITLFIVINTTIGFFQEHRSEKALELLQKFISPKARVKRSHEVITVKKEELVPGDLVVLRMGDVVPADLRLIKTYSFEIDESVLTGESYPVRKTETKVAKVKDVYLASNIVFAGTTVIEGEAEGVVFAKGSETEFGKISTLTSATERIGVFEKEIDKLSRFILKVVLGTLVLVVLGNLIIKGDQVRPLELIIFAIALAVSVIPEALPIVTTFSLSSGALRLAKNKVVVRRLTAIEDLGSIEVLCTDKTGTITKNELAIEEINSKDKDKTLLYAAVCSSHTGFHSKSDFDYAIISALTKFQLNEISKFKIIKETPFNPTTRRNESLVEIEGKKLTIIRGAPEDLIRESTGEPSQKKELLSWVSKNGIRGYRSLAVVIKENSKLSLVGLISFSDPIKESAKEAVDSAEKLGVVIKILTGDGIEVAGNVAKQIEIVKDAGDVILGDDFEKLDLHEQHQAVEKFNVFARVTPEQKYKIIKLLQEKHEVGFLGEGINDAPALKIANVAIVVDEAADISRESADIILLRKSLKVIVNGIREGRGVYANTTKYIKATLSSNLGNFYAVALASFLIDFLPMLPVQLLLVNLISDFPMVSVATDNVDDRDIDKPRRYTIKELALMASTLGLVSTVFDFIFFALLRNYSPSVLQTGWFMGSVLTELVFLFSIRTKFFFLKAKRPSTPLLILTSLAAVGTIIIPQTLFGQEFFKFTPLSLPLTLLVIFVVLIYFSLSEVVKLLVYKLYPDKAK